MTASKSKILAIAMIVAVALFLALFSIFASSFSNREETAAEPEPTTAAVPPRTICFIVGDMSDATQYDLAKKIGFLVGDMSGYTYMLFDAEGNTPTQVALIDEAMTYEPAYLIIDPVSKSSTMVASKIVKIDGVGVINVDGDVSFIGKDNLCNVVYDMEEAARLSKANGNCPITADAMVIAQVEAIGNGALAAVYLDNAELARAVAMSISNAGGGTAMTGATLSPQLVTVR